MRRTYRHHPRAASLGRTRLLIIDDWEPEPLTAEQRRDLLEIVGDRYEKGSLLVTSQIPVTGWHELVGDPTIGDAILDRVVHRAHRFELKGPSLRKRHAVIALDDDERLTNAKGKMRGNNRRWYRPPHAADRSQTPAQVAASSCS